MSGTLAQATADLETALRLLDHGQFDQAHRLLAPLAAQGNAEAQTNLALLYYFGRGVVADENRAHALFSQAAGAGDAAAMFWLGRMALLGDGPDAGGSDADRAAARWFFEAARRGHADAQYHLGLLLLVGTGVYPDRAEAMKWIGRAAAAGHPAAKQFSVTADEAPASR